MCASRERERDRRTNGRKEWAKREALGSSGTERARQRQRVIRGTSDAKGKEETRDREDRSLIRTFHTQTERRADGSRAQDETENQGSERQVLSKRTETEQRMSDGKERERVRERDAARQLKQS